MNLTDVYKNRKLEIKVGDWIRITRVNRCGYTELRKHDCKPIYNGNCYQVEDMIESSCIDHCIRSISDCEGNKGKFVIRAKHMDVGLDYYFSSCFFEYEKI